ncbi:hypothetical protein [Oscillibacter ruminantium]|uniref:hypothetical protein n=1 Tax=Oscillibacter ruminantium TaxID=1263547 RepID=UPI003332C040
MGKTPETLRLEDAIWSATKNQGTFGCFEVTIGWFGKERVDYMTYNTKGEFRCYEIKVSVADFHSKAAITFVGDFNYYVLTRELYEKVKDEIPKGIGVYIGGLCERRATRQPLKADRQVLFESMIRSLSREYQATRKSADRKYMERLCREAHNAERAAKMDRDRYMELRNATYAVFGNEGAERIRRYYRETEAVHE